MSWNLSERCWDICSEFDSDDEICYLVGQRQRSRTPESKVLHAELETSCEGFEDEDVDNIDEERYVSVCWETDIPGPYKELIAIHIEA